MIWITNSDFCFRSFSSAVFAVSQIKSTRNQNQRTCVDVFSGNFEEKNEGETSTYQQFQITIRRNGGNIHQAESFENKILNKVSANPQKEQHRQLKRSRSEPNFTGSRERNQAGDKREIKQHRDAIFFRGDHFFYQNILQRKKKSRADRNAIKNVEMEFIIGRPSRDNCQSDESDQCCDPSKFGYVFTEKNFRKHERKQRNRPKNGNDFSQWQFDDGVNVEEETYRTENSTDDIQEKLICFERRSAMSDYERKQGNKTEKKSEKSHLESTESLPHEFRNNIVGAADKHLAEKKHNPLPILIQDHKFSEIKSKLLITFMVNNENIF